MANLTQTYVEVARSVVIPASITLTQSYVEVARSLIEPPLFIETDLDLDVNLSAGIAVEADLEDRLTFSVVVTGFEKFDEDLEEELQLVDLLVTPPGINLSQTYVEVARTVVKPDAISLTQSYVEVARSLILPPAFIAVDLNLEAELVGGIAVEADFEDQLIFNTSLSIAQQFDGGLEEEIQLVDILTIPPSINLSQTYVEVARAVVKPDSVSLTQSYVEVARSLVAPPAFIEVDLDLDTEVEGSLDVEAEVEDQLVFDTSISSPTQFDEELTEEIQFVVTLDSPFFNEEFSEVVLFDADIEADTPVNLVDIDFAETVVFDANIDADAPVSFTETLALSETISEVRIFELEINAPLELDGELTACHVLNLEIVADVLNEQVTFEFDGMGVGGEIVTVDLDTTIQLQEIFQLGIVEDLIFDGVMNGHIVRPGPEDQIDESITFEDRMVLSTLVRFDDVVDFSDEMTAIVARTFEADLGFDDVFDSQAELNADTVEVLDFQIIMTSLVEDNDTCRFDTRQFPAYVDPTDDPALGDSGTLRLVSPAEGPVASLIQLKAPNFQNRHNIAPTRTVNETRLGELIIFAAELAGPPVETLLLSFSGLKREQVRMVEQWHDDHLGQQIRLVDHEDRVWIGFISVVDDPGVEDRKMSYTLSFQFQGSLV